MFSAQQSDIPEHVKIYLLCKTWRININILPPQPLTGATCLPHYTHFRCIQPLNRRRCRYLDIYLCAHYTHTRVFIIICPIHCYQYEWKPGRRTEDCWDEDHHNHDHDDARKRWAVRQNKTVDNNGADIWDMGGGGTVDTTRKCCPYCDTVHPPRPAPPRTTPHQPLHSDWIRSSQEIKCIYTRLLNRGKLQLLSWTIYFPQVYTF